MNIRDFFTRSRSNVLHTKYGDFNLAKKADQRRLQRVVIDLQRTTDALTRKDLRDWRNAWQMAINVDSPNRQRLYDIYRDVDVDLHLTGCIQQRTGFVLAHSFKLVKPSGAEDEQATKMLDTAWFKQFVRYILQANYWGHSLIELGNVVQTAEGFPAYDGVSLIPRKHVIPEHHCVITDLGQDWTSGIDYRQPPFADWLIEVGQPDSLGLFLKAATQTIPKKNAMSFWDTFAEIFGMPWRVAKTTSRDEKDIKNISQQLNDMAANATAVLPMDSEIQIVESSKGDAFNVYDKRIDRANTELSKLIIGQTMTIEDGSSLSQSETHLKVFENLVDQDCDTIRDVANDQLLPRMLRHGFPVKGLRFEWDYAEDYTPSQQVAYETMVADRYDVDPEYFADKYNMPVGERRNNSPALPAEDDDEDGKQQDPNNAQDPRSKKKTIDDKGNDDGKQHNPRPFFD